MKNTIWGLGLLLCLTTSLQAQVKLGLMTGIAPSHIDAGETISANIDDTTRYTITNAQASWHAGPFLRLQARGLYLKAAALGAYSRVAYTQAPANDPNAAASAGAEDNYQIDVPLSLGYNRDRIYGDVGVIFSKQLLPEEGNLLTTNPFEGLFSTDKMGYKAGIGLDLDWQISLEINYAYYPNASDRIILDNTVDYNFDLRPHYLMVNFSWNFSRAGWY